MNLLSAENLTKSFGERVLFQNISFGLARGRRVALVARNGTGKSTLLNILAGKDVPDAGTLSLRTGTTLGYLPQQPVFAAGLTVLQAVLDADTPLQQAVRAYEEVTAQATPDTKLLQQALDRMQVLNAWDYENEVKQVLQRLGVTQLDAPVDALSGGQQKRVALACILLRKPDVFILDEPTNHLDIGMVEWLEAYLKNQDATLLLVTHDRYFLESLCPQQLELADRTLYAYNGTYADFLEAREARLANQQAERDRARNLLRTELEWMRRQPKARGTKAKARIDAFYDLQTKAAAPREQKDIALQVDMARLGSKILELQSVGKQFGERVMLRDFSYVFKKGERLGIVGPNGTGKSTFLNILTGNLQPDSGTVTVGDTIVYGYYTQGGLQFQQEDRVIDVIKKIAEVFPVGRDETLSATQMLSRFQFDPQRQYTPVANLSGGERRRLHLLTVLVRRPNFLILDEPTNDLDLQTLQVLEDFLLAYEGCLIIVSHDRCFLDRLADHLFIFEGNGRIVDFIGNYTDYREARQQTESANGAEAKPASESAPPETKTARKATYKEKQAYEKLTQELEQLEQRKTELETALGTTTDPAELLRLSHEVAACIAAIETKTDQWLQLAEVVG